MFPNFSFKRYNSYMDFTFKFTNSYYWFKTTTFIPGNMKKLVLRYYLCSHINFIVNVNYVVGDHRETQKIFFG